MSEIFLHIHSDIPSAFCVNGEQIGFCSKPTDFISISVEKEEFVLYVYPLEQTLPHTSFISYSAKINCKNAKPLCNNSLLTITDYGQGNFVIMCNSLKINKPTTTTFCTSLENTSLTILQNNLYLANDKNSLSFIPKTPLKDAKLTKFQEFLIIWGKTYTNKDNILITNSNLNLIFDSIADKIEIEDNHIITLQRVNDIAMHGVVNEYQLQNEQVTHLKEYTVYTQNTPISPANTFAIPYALLEAIAIGNFSLARSYLHPSLSATLQDEHLERYFDNFIEATPAFNHPLNVLALVYPGNPRFVKNFLFDIADNRVLNIDSVE